MEKLEQSELQVTIIPLYGTVNSLKFCDFENLQSLFHSEMNHLELCVIE